MIQCMVKVPVKLDLTGVIVVSPLMLLLMTMVDFMMQQGNLWAEGPFDPDTPGEAWKVLNDMEYMWDAEWITVEAGTMVDYDTLSLCLAYSADCPLDGL